MAWPIVLGQGFASYSLVNAQDALAGFAFGQEPLRWPTQMTPQVATVPPRQRYKWGYRNFDCVPTTPNGFSSADVALTTALDIPRLSAATLLGVDAVANDIACCLAEIPTELCFWHLPLADVGSIAPTAASPAYPLWVAYELLAGLPGVGPTVASKALHHKRPSVFPMVDRRTLPHLGNVALAWQAIHIELNRYQREFARLEAWFAALAVKKNAVPLRRLRIYDILLWATASGQDAPMMLIGSTVPR